MAGGFSCTCSAPYYGPTCELGGPKEQTVSLQATTTGLNHTVTDPASKKGRGFKTKTGAPQK